MGHCLGHTTTTMNTFLFFSTLIAYCSASTTVVGNAAPYLVRAPAHDSASIEHHRLGGNFAYSTAEAHAFAEVIPQISTLTHPVAETTHTHIPAPIATHQPAPLSRPTTLPSPSSRTSPPTEPSPSPDLSVPTRLSTSQLSTRPAPTLSRLFPRLLPPQSTLSPMSQLLLMLLPQLPLLLTPLLPLLLLMLLPQLPTLLMLLPLLPTLLTLLPQLSLLKQHPKC